MHSANKELISVSRITSMKSISNAEKKFVKKQEAFEYQEAKMQILTLSN